MAQSLTLNLSLYPSALICCTCREITIQLNIPQFSRTIQILIMASIAMIGYMIFSAQTAAGHVSIQQENNNIKIVVQFDNKAAPTHCNSV
jgi:hypothetical protein